jgi:hypothetical protein
VDGFDPGRYTAYHNNYVSRYLAKPGKEVFYDAMEYQDMSGNYATNKPTVDTTRAAIEWLFESADKSRKPTSSSNIPAKLTYDEWITRERLFRDRLWVAEELYDTIPADTVYIARDKNNVNVLAVFPNGLGIAYGHQAASKYIRNMIHNLGEYARSQPPPAVDDCRHIHHKWLVDRNPHLQPPNGRCGVFHWGTWPELGKQKGLLLTKDTVKGGTRSNPRMVPIHGDTDSRP